MALFAAALIGYSVSPSYSQEAIFCSGFEDCPAGDPVLEGRIAELEALLAGVSRGTDPISSQDTLTFTGMNLQIVNGTGENLGNPNGTGNVIIGYNPSRLVYGNQCPDGRYCDRRNGSHYLVMGHRNNYTDVGGIVLGVWNESNAQFSALIGGGYNFATGPKAVVIGGVENIASGEGAYVSGGRFNLASGNNSAVSGGLSNTASQGLSSVSGGGNNTASGVYSSVSGGRQNTASGDYSSVSGGLSGVASGEYDWVAGSLFEDQ